MTSSGDVRTWKDKKTNKVGLNGSGVVALKLCIISWICCLVLLEVCSEWLIWTWKLRLKVMDPVNLTVEMRDVYQKPKKRQGSSGSSSLPVERKKSKHCSMLVKSLVLVIVLLVLCCLVLLSLYLIERDRNSQPEETMISVNSTTQTSKQQSHYGGLCWSRDCLQAASGRAHKKFSIT